MTSIGINGEHADAYDGKPKPAIRIREGGLFVTGCAHLKQHTGEYDIIGVFRGRDKPFIIGKCRRSVEMVIEGPNTGDEMRRLKTMLADLAGDCRLLIDGSIDRRFIARPEISDGFYFALLITRRKTHIQKAARLLAPLRFPSASKAEIELIGKYVDGSDKSVLIDREGEAIRRSRAVPALDSDLETACLKHRSDARLLYLNGALTQKLSRFLSPFRNLTVVLDNFTLHRPAASVDAPMTGFTPAVKLLTPVSVRAVFIKVEDRADLRTAAVPENIPVYNLFRECPDEIGI